MSYRLRTDEPVADGLRRCAREQLEAAISSLDEDVHEDPVTAVHSARKALKKERSLLRLSRGVLDPRQRRKENRALRLAAQQLGRARDADALFDALAAINERFSGQLPEATTLAIQERLREERYAARTTLLDEEIPTRVIEVLRASRQRIDGWRVRAAGWSRLSVGLTREYARGRRAMRRAAKAPTPKRMHDWRKRSKDLWYQLRLLEPMAPGTIRGQAKDAHRLADVLGDLHDLAVLEAALPRLAEGIVVDTDALRALIEHRSGQLSAEAFSIGERVYAEAPQRFARRLRAYWRAWRAQARAAADSRPVELAQITRHRATAA
jgi:CHAD domain-containing protein